jgi:Calcineurin-like phosphoesterase superfamily domain
MRVHVFSDLHLEFGSLELSPEVRSGTLAELVLLAGDIDVRRRAPSWAAQTFSQRVAMIGGNHEAYGDHLFATIAASREAAELASRDRQHPVRFLERETWVMTARDGTAVRVIGCTLWTDFEFEAMPTVIARWRPRTRR